MIHNPGRVFGLWPRKVRVIFGRDIEGFDYSLGGMPGLECGRKILCKNVVRLRQPYYVLMIALFAVSLPIVLKIPIRPQHIGLAIIVSLTLVHLVLIGHPRYHFPMMPWVAIYSGLGAQALLLGKSSLRIAESGEDPAYRKYKAPFHGTPARVHPASPGA